MATYEKQIEDYPLDKDSSVYDDLSIYKEFQGLLVTKGGLVFRRDGTQVKPNYVMKTLEDGTKKLNLITIKYTYQKETKTKSYQRFVYAAWNEDFDMDDSNIVVVSKTENRFEFRPEFLTHITRAEHLKNISEMNRLYTDEERKEIIERYMEIQDVITVERFCEALEMSPPTFYEMRREYLDKYGE